MSEVIGYQFNVNADYLDQPVTIMCGCMQDGFIGDLASGSSSDTAPAVIGATVKVPYMLSSGQYRNTGEGSLEKRVRKTHNNVTLSTSGGGAYDVEWGDYVDQSPGVPEPGVMRRRFYLSIDTTAASRSEPSMVDVRNYWRNKFVKAVGGY